MNVNQRPSGSQYEMRREQRALQVRRTVQIVANGRRMPFSLYNLSSRGAAGRAIFPVRTGTHVTVQFENGFALEGRVRWTRAGLFGIAFRGVVPETLIRPAHRIQQARSQRIETALPAMLVTRNQSSPCIVRNASATGLKVECDVKLAPGQVVSILTDGIDCCGQVCWVAHGTAGIRTLSRIDPSRFVAGNFNEPDGTESRATAGSAWRVRHA